MTSETETAERTDPDRPTGTRPGLVLVPAGRWCLLGGALLLTVAAYFAWVPLSLPTAGSPFVCGSAASPPSESFPRSTCAIVTGVYQARAISALAAAVLLGLGGVVLFGLRRVPRRSEPESSEPAGPDIATSETGPDRTTSDAGPDTTTSDAGQRETTSDDTEPSDNPTDDTGQSETAPDDTEPSDNPTDDTGPSDNPTEPQTAKQRRLRNRGQVKRDRPT